ncbi:DNA repair protein rad2 [Thecaphora frezii]
MGVQGLWQLLQPVARPIKLETLEGKRLAIDSSIWLYHFQMAMRDKEGRTLSNAHILGFLWRILKLLFHGIRPVFVFDGGAPVMKRRTLTNRKARRQGAKESHARTAEKLLAAQLRQAAVKHVAEGRMEQTDQQDAGLDDNTVYFDDLQQGRSQALARSDLQEHASPSGSLASSSQNVSRNASPSKAGSPSKPKKPDWHKDPYALPALEHDLNTLSAQNGKRGKRADYRFATEGELRAVMSTIAPEDLDTESELFRSLPPELQYELVGDLRAQSRMTSYKRLQSMLATAPTPIDFSRAQIAGLKTRNDLTQKVLTVTDEIGSANIKVPLRVAGERNKEYVLVRNPGAEGGFVLGVRDSGTSVEKAIDVDDMEVKADTTDEDHANTDPEVELEMDEVEIPQIEASDTSADQIDREVAALREEADPVLRKEKALEILQMRAKQHARQARKESGLELDDGDARPRLVPRARERPLFIRNSIAKRKAPMPRSVAIDGMDDDDDDDGDDDVGIDDVAGGIHRTPLDVDDELDADEAEDLSRALQASEMEQSVEPRRLYGFGLSSRGGEPVSLHSAIRASSGKRLDTDPAPAAQVPGPRLLSKDKLENTPGSRQEPTIVADSEDEDLEFEEVEVPLNANLATKPDLPAQVPAPNAGRQLDTETSEASPSHATPGPQEPAKVSDRMKVLAALVQRNRQASSVYPSSPKKQLLPAKTTSPMGRLASDLSRSSEAPKSVIPRDAAEPGATKSAGDSKRIKQLAALAERDRLAWNAESAEGQKPHAPAAKPVASEASPEPATVPPLDAPSPADSGNPAKAEGPILALEAPSLAKLASESAPRLAAPQSRPALEPLWPQEDLGQAETVLKRNDAVASTTLEQSTPPREEREQEKQVREQEREKLQQSEPQREKLKREERKREEQQREREEQEQEQRRAVSPSVKPSVSRPGSSSVPSPAKVLTDVKENDQQVSSRASSREGTPIEWSPSPSPEPVMLGADGFPLPTAEELEAMDAKDEEEIARLTADQNEFAAFLSASKGRSLLDVQQEVESEVNALRAEHANSRRSEEDITRQMAQEIQMMLRLFGLPYITAPMEAEAQCAELVSRRLVDGIITDDSDVFLFGGTRIYKNMFNNNKVVECFLLSDLQRELGLDREKLIRLAYYLGSDYTEGLPGVGPVMAMELLALFSGEDGLLKFRDWWRKVQMGKDTPEDTRGKTMRRIKKTLRNKVHLAPSWPEPEVLDAYYQPTVDESDEPFQWGLPDLDSLRTFLGEYLHWPVSKTDQYLLPIIEKQNQRSRARGNQTTLDRNGFFDTTAGLGVYAGRKKPTYGSNRLQEVINGFRAANKSKAAASGAGATSGGASRLRHRRAADEATSSEDSDSTASSSDGVVVVETNLRAHIPEELLGKEMGKRRPVVRRDEAGTTTNATHEARVAELDAAVEALEGQRPDASPAKRTKKAPANETTRGEKRKGKSKTKENEAPAGARGAAQEAEERGESSSGADEWRPTAKRGRGRGRGHAAATGTTRGRASAAAPRRRGRGAKANLQAARNLSLDDVHSIPESRSPSIPPGRLSRSSSSTNSSISMPR